jgi:hypothetical protein
MNILKYRKNFKFYIFINDIFLFLLNYLKNVLYFGKNFWILIDKISKFKNENNFFFYK